MGLPAPADCADESLHSGPSAAARMPRITADSVRPWLAARVLSPARRPRRSTVKNSRLGDDMARRSDGQTLRQTGNEIRDSLPQRDKIDVATFMLGLVQASKGLLEPGAGCVGLGEQRGP
jgi:hypothetical protein